MKTILQRGKYPRRFTSPYGFEVHMWKRGFLLYLNRPAQKIRIWFAGLFTTLSLLPSIALFITSKWIYGLVTMMVYSLSILFLWKNEDFHRMEVRLLGKSLRFINRYPLNFESNRLVHLTKLTDMTLHLVDSSEENGAGQSRIAFHCTDGRQVEFFPENTSQVEWIYLFIRSQIRRQGGLQAA